MEYLIVIPILLTIATLLNIYVMLKVARQEKELEKKIDDNLSEIAEIKEKCKNCKVIKV